MIKNQKIKYFLWAARHLYSLRNCPSCNSENVKIIQRKYLVTTLNECDNCRLRFRHPLEKFRNSNEFYQNDYVEPDGITTSIDQIAINDQLNFGYKELRNEFDAICNLINKTCNEISILDYGSSWGYQSYQFKKKGFNTYSFEISIPRLSFGNKYLGLNITNVLNEIPKIDVFYSSHVIEHLEDPTIMFEVADDKTKNGGLVFLKCPNGSFEFEQKSPEIYKKMWGLVHPNFITSKWVVRNLDEKNKKYFISSFEDDKLYKEITRWNKEERYIGNLENPNLTIIYFN